jgi:hypothetical protein
MATLIAELRKQAKELGIAPSVIRDAKSSSELKEIIASESGGSKKKNSGKKSGVQVVAKKKSGKKSKTKTADKKTAKSKSTKAAPAPTATKTKKTAKSKKAGNKKAQAGGNGGKHTLGDVDYSENDDWNPREGSGPDRIVRLLRKFKGNRTKVREYIVSKGLLWEFVEKKNSAGVKRSKDQAENYLSYRISKTAWDFAVKTGQHKASNKRAEYGTAGTSNNDRERFGMAQRAKVKKSTPKAKKAAPAAAKKATPKTGAKKTGRGKRKVNPKAAGRRAAAKK